MATAVYVVVIALALAPQLLFTVLYWKWIPGWTKNPYGRLAQVDSWSQILLLSIFLVFVLVGPHLTVEYKRVIMAICLLPFVFVGFFRLILLKKAVDSSKTDQGDGNDS